ncbi:MAG: epoxyqueuosine reductase QueH [bacterium]
MRILLHICCANCAIYPVRTLREEGHEVTGLFFNPNIQPYEEHQRRGQALETLSRHMDFQVIFWDRYPLEEFFRRVVFREAHRCFLCYQWRLETTAKVARRGRFEAFSTTLLFSKRQAHEVVRQVGEAQSKGGSVGFFYRDFRVGWKEATRASLELGIYRQKYCGCIYSEAERYAGRKKISVR